MALTSLEIARAATDGKPLKLPDGNGLYLYATKTAKSWRTDYGSAVGVARSFTGSTLQLPSLKLASETERPSGC